MTVSPRYQGSAGESYASWQLRVADALGAETARRFRPFVSDGNVCLDFGCGGGGVLTNSMFAVESESNRTRQRATLRPPGVYR